MALTNEQFLRALGEGAILTADEIAALTRRLPADQLSADAQALARELVKQHKLTQFQAAAIYQGKGKNLLLGEYLLRDKIGAGGMGQVFKAHHRKMKRVVALKVLPNALTKDPQAIKRFLREVEAVARLEHPNIVTAHDAGEAGGVHFLVMQYVEGSDLAGLVKKAGPMKPAEAAQCVLQAARGLERAHGQGVVHRDIKPSNLLLDKHGTVKVLDMGLARFEGIGSGEVDDGLTNTGSVMGTIDFMSPEQVLDTKHADHRTDIYSLGCTLYYLLTGHKIYDGDTVLKKLLAHRESPIPALPAATPDGLDAIYRRMVAKSADNRYQTMSEVVQDLEALLSGAASLDDPTAEFTGSAPSEGSLARYLDQISAGTVVQAKVTTDDTHNHEQILNTIRSVEHRPEAAGGPRKTTDGRQKHADKKHAPRSLRDRRSRAEGAGRGPRNRILVGAGFAAFACILLAVWIIFKNEKGEEVKRIQVPAGQSVELHNDPAPVVAEEPSGPTPLVAPFDAKQARASQEAWARKLDTKVETSNSIGMRMTLIPPGEFLMGSSPEQNAVAVQMANDAKVGTNDWQWKRLREEIPQHRVKLSRPFLLGTTEVTVGQFKRFVEATRYVTEGEQFGFGSSDKTTLSEKITEQMKARTWHAPGYAVTDDSPVTQVTWHDTVRFCNWASDQDKLRPCYRQDAMDGWILLKPSSYSGSSAELLTAGFGYRLPTEAEWEYACRAGTITQFSFGDDLAQFDKYGWSAVDKSPRSARAVGLKLPNAFGLFDMHGNVFEWCQDFYAGDYYAKSSAVDPTGPTASNERVTRGGTWTNLPYEGRSAYRLDVSPVLRSSAAGFRVARPW